MKKSTIILSTIIFFLVWEIVSRSGLINPALFPPPGVIVKAAITMFKTGELVWDIFASIQRVVLGFFLASIFGISFGLLTGRIKFIEKTIGPIIQLLRPIPSIALVPLAIVWFGLGEISKYFLVFWGAFFPIWVNTHLGAKAVDRKILWAAKSLGAKGTKILYEIVLPASIPYIIAGMRIGIGIAFICLVAAEMAGAFRGVGYRIYASHLIFRVDKMMVGILFLGILGSSADRLFAFIVNRVFPWYQKTLKTQ